MSLPRSLSLSDSDTEELQPASPLVVSLPRSLSLSDSDTEELQPASPLVVSLPPLSNSDSDLVVDASALLTKLQSIKLPNDWICAPRLLADEVIALCKLGVHPPLMSPTTTFTITIAHDLSWVVRFQDKEVKSSSTHLLQSVCQKLSTVNKVIQLIECVDTIRACPGNPDEKFHILIERRQGVFRGHSGIFYSYSHVNKKLCM